MVFASNASKEETTAAEIEMKSASFQAYIRKHIPKSKAMPVCPQKGTGMAFHIKFLRND